MRVSVRHNAEIAHRLSLSPGKCQQIHGHGLQIELTLLNLSQELHTGMATNAHGKVLDFSEVKKRFRLYIDEGYDHKLLLNESDPWAQPLLVASDMGEEAWETRSTLPGLRTFPGDPTIENLCKWIAFWSADTFKCNVRVKIDETRTNSAQVEAIFGNQEAIVL